MRLLNADPGDNSTRISYDWTRGQKGFLAVWGTFDGATITLEFSPDDEVTWVAIGSETTLTAPGCAVFQLGRYPIRASVSNDGASTEVYAHAQAVEA